MTRKLLYALLCLAVVSARTVDIHITDEPKCELRVSGGCSAECESGETECYAGSCGPGGCCVEGYKEKLCCKDGCPEGSHPAKEKKIEKKPEKKQDIIVSPLDQNCHWEGTAPSCVTGCARGRICGLDACGDGACCWTGWKTWCCDSCSNSSPISKLLQTPLEL